MQLSSDDIPKITVLLPAPQCLLVIERSETAMLPYSPCVLSLICRVRTGTLRQPLEKIVDAIAHPSHAPHHLPEFDFFAALDAGEQLASFICQFVRCCVRPALAACFNTRLTCGMKLRTPYRFSALTSTKTVWVRSLALTCGVGTGAVAGIPCRVSSVKSDSQNLRTVRSRTL